MHVSSVLRFDLALCFQGVTRNGIAVPYTLDPVTGRVSVEIDLATGTGEFFRLRQQMDPTKPPVGPVNITDYVDRIKLEAPEGEPLRLEFDSFVSAINGESPVVVTGEDGRRALAVALRIVAEIERTRPAFTGEVAAARA